MATALSRALPTRSGASSTTSGTSGGRGEQRTAGPRIASISAALSGFAEARTSLSTSTRRLRPHRRRRREHGLLGGEQLLDAALGEAEHGVERCPVERLGLGRAL